MPSEIPIRQVNVDRATRERLTNTAFLLDTSLSDLARTIVEAINAEKKVESSKYAVDPGPITGKELVRFGFLIEDEPWDKFGEQAYRARSSRSKMFRAYVNEHYGHVPVNRAEMIKEVPRA